MIIAKYPDAGQLKQLLQRPAIDWETVSQQVAGILSDVRQRGDLAVREYSNRFDGVSLDNMLVGESEFSYAVGLVSEELKIAIQNAARNIEKFHASQKEVFAPIETQPGVLCWRKSVGIEKVGIYIPGGTAPLFSTVLMLGIPAKLAGCREVVLCTPPGTDGKIHPAILFAAQLVGVTRIFKVGGAQAIAAMAYGTSTIPKVSKIFGPGNRYVTTAKMLVLKDGVSIDMPAGPSEVMVFADSSAVPEFVAADLLSQAEHDVDSQTILVTTSEQLLEEVLLELERQAQLLPRQKMINQALLHSVGLLVKSPMEALEAINIYAPEHLIFACENAREIAEKVLNAGSVFIGNYTPESAGDYASGTNHTLPTNGYARSYSGVSLDSFVRKITFQQISQEGLHSLAPTIIAMAEAECLPAHAEAVRLRLKTMNF